MQLSIEKYITTPQHEGKLPAHSVFIDLINMFNAVSCKELVDVIKTDFPELTELTSLFYR